MAGERDEGEAEEIEGGKRRKIIKIKKTESGCKRSVVRSVA